MALPLLGYAEKSGARDAILVSAGRTENISKYLELAYDLYHGLAEASVCLSITADKGCRTVLFPMNAKAT